jgi:hypothetical protein
MSLGRFQIGVIDLPNQPESSARHYCFALVQVLEYDGRRHHSSTQTCSLTLLTTLKLASTNYTVVLHSTFGGL